MIAGTELEQNCAFSAKSCDYFSIEQLRKNVILLIKHYNDFTYWLIYLHPQFVLQFKRNIAQ